MRRKNITKLAPKVAPKNQNKKSKNKPAQAAHANKEDDSHDESHSDSDSSVYSGIGEDETTSSDDTSLDSDSDGEDQHVDGISNRSSKSSEVVTAPSKPDEYAHDSSDEEDIKNTVGDIPMRWYDDYDHLGYDWDGQKILKPAKVDELDNFINKMEDPNYWRTVHDPLTGQNVVLSDEDVIAVKRIQAGLYPDPNYNPYEPWIDFFSHETMIHPLFNRLDSKQSFIPSLIEKRQVSKMLHAIKMGWSKPRVEQPEEDKYYLLWDQNEQVQISQRMQHYLPAPKLKLPGHEESYNPPPEYLFTSEEEEKWKNDDPEDRKLNFIPRRYSSLREVPYYSNFIKERFERCLDLYLCPRQQKMKLNVNPEDLIPKLPKPKDLQPFPTTLAMVYRGHTNMVRCITVEHSGQYLASGSDDCTIKIWEIQTGRCLKTIPTEAPVTSIAWCPSPNVCLVAATVNRNVIILNPQVGNCNTVSDTDIIFNIPLEAEAETSKKAIEWKLANEEEYQKAYRMLIEHSKDVSQVVWHAKGDYFASLMPSGGKASVHIHQLSKRRSQQPFSKSKGLVQGVLFHPSRPYFFVATQRYIRIYNLIKQELTKKLMTNCKWVSSIAVHPGGDNVICGSYDSRLSWFDLDLSNKPYQTLRHQKKAIRKVSFHPRYPLFASASDDCSVVICHGMVYSDLLQNPLIVPVKVLHGHSSKNDVGVMDCQFHPTQPWIFTSGADGNVFLYT